MKKKLFFAGMAALLLSFGLVLTGCNDSGSGTNSNTDPKSITITGLTGKSGEVGIEVSAVINGEPEEVADGDGTISDGSVTIQLKDDKKDDGSDWSGTGSYIIVISFKEDESSYVYTAGKTFGELGITDIRRDFDKLRKYTITETTSEIPFSDFQLMPDDDDDDDDDPEALVIAGIDQTLHDQVETGIYVALVSPGTIPDGSNAVAAADSENAEFSSSGNTYYILTIELWTQTGEDWELWTGSGTYDVYLVLGANPQDPNAITYVASNVSFTSGAASLSAATGGDFELVQRQ